MGPNHFRQTFQDPWSLDLPNDAQLNGLLRLPQAGEIPRFCSEKRVQYCGDRM